MLPGRQVKHSALMQSHSAFVPHNVDDEEEGGLSLAEIIGLTSKADLSTKPFAIFDTHLQNINY